MSGEPRPAKSAFEVATLLASAARAASANGDGVRLPLSTAYAFVLDVSAAGSAADDLLDVYVQTKLDGTNWVDVAHFTQVLGNGGAKRYVTKIIPGIVNQAEFAPATALSAAAVRHLAGDEWRAICVITNGAGTHSFTFSVTAIPQ